MMTYRCKRSLKGQLIERKARCLARGDKIVAYFHYDPDNTAAYTAEKTTLRLLLALIAARWLYYEHFGIKSAFVHEDYAYRNPVLIKRPPKFDDTLRHPGETAGILM